MKQSKIIFVHLYNDRSGSPKVLAQIITAIMLAGREGELLTSGHQDGFLTDVLVAKRTLFYRRSHHKWLTMLWYALSQMLLFVQCLRYWRQDVVFYINTMMPAGAALAGWLMGKPVIYHVHETSINPPLFKHCLRAVIQLTASKVIFVSKFLQQQEAFTNKPQTWLHNAITFPELQVTEKYTFNILMMCSLKAYKGVDEFVRLASMLVNEPSISFTLVLNADEAEINDYFFVAQPANLTVLARQQEVAPFYREACVLLNLSRPHEWVETFGLTILEAMSYGVPVIAPPVGGPAEIVQDGQEGFLLACTQLDEIAEQLVRWSKEPTYYAGFCKRALSRAGDFNITTFNCAVLNIVD